MSPRAVRTSEGENFASESFQLGVKSCSPRPEGVEALDVRVELNIIIGTRAHRQGGLLLVLPACDW